MFSVKYLSVIVSHCSTGTPNASLNSKVNRSGTAMIEVMGVRDGVIYLKILAELIRDNQSFLIKRHCHGWLVRCCHPVAALFLADVVIRQHVRLLGYSRVFVFVVIIESHGHNNFYTFGKKKRKKMVFRFGMQYMSKNEEGYGTLCLAANAAWSGIQITSLEKRSLWRRKA